MPYLFVCHAIVAAAGCRDSLALYESVLAGFLADPGSRANLHRGLARRLMRAPV